MKVNKKNIKLIIIILIFMMIVTFGIYIIIKNNKQNEPTIEEKINDKTIETLSIESTDIIGYLKIDSINLYAPIQDGTDLETLSKAIGHFQDTAYFSGNICLAAHNRGNKQNFFENLKNIKVNDEIKYITKYEEKMYYVSEIKEIEETNLSVLESTEQDQLTLITCIADKKDKRLCVIAK
ncbi:MAG: class D sortase [Clostridia bacterium]|nr:class D sortase [Clostridia bacterium]